MTAARTVVALALALTLAGCAAGGATRTRAGITFPPTSPVAPAASSELGGRRFAGRFSMAGAFRYEAGNARREARLEFEPDAAIAQRLPYFTQLGHVRRIAFDNASSFIEDALPPATLARLARGEITTVSGRARIVVDGLFAALACDQPAYAVTFVAVEQVELDAAPRAPSPDPAGC